MDCVKLAARKADTWLLRQHPKVLALPFKAGTKRQEKVNARVRFIDGDMLPFELEQFAGLIACDRPAPLNDEERRQWVQSKTGVSMSSDAFFPFPDSIHCAAMHGVSFVVHPGGSQGDDVVRQAADEYGMTVVHSGLRLFHH